MQEKKILLIILDGWGYSSKYHGNAVKQAQTPTLDLLWHKQPKTLLHASENYVGLPEKQVGNSEVGHVTIGAGRTINQALVRISKSIELGIFFTNNIIHSVYQKASKKNKQVHLIGLCSDGGVHSHIQHLIALIQISKSYKNIKTCLHIITDGRDTEPQSAMNFMHLIIKEVKNYANIKICTISGRYYSMDRDCRWHRTMESYKCLTSNKVQEDTCDIFQVINQHYAKNIYDEFIIPTRINKGAIENNDGIICFNFRPDRMRQLAQVLCGHSFEGFKREKVTNINMITFTQYDSKLNLPVVFEKIGNKNFLGQIISEQGFKQFRLAETEKYAHVTYFFNGGQEAPFPGENRELIASPRVETYDLTPKMSANNITKKLIDAAKGGEYKLIVVNYANPDMIGHTGNLKASKEAMEAVDHCIDRLIKSIQDQQETKIMITADHGNADGMLNKNNEVCKSHTRNLVPFILVNPSNYLAKTKNQKEVKLKQPGSLADIAPTILDLLSINQPIDMNGESLIRPGAR